MSELANPKVKLQVFEETNKPFQLENIQLQSDLKPEETLVKIISATICGSDYHTIDEERKEDTPRVLIHEAVCNFNNQVKYHRFFVKTPSFLP